MTPRTATLYLAAVLLAVFVGYVDTHNAEVQAAALVILVGAGILALIEPRAAWRWALIIGLSIPVTYLVTPLFGFEPPFDMANYWGTFVAFIPAFIGAYAGVLARWVLSRWQAR